MRHNDQVEINVVSETPAYLLKHTRTDAAAVEEALTKSDDFMKTEIHPNPLTQNLHHLAFINWTATSVQGEKPVTQIVVEQFRFHGRSSIAWWGIVKAADRRRRGESSYWTPAVEKYHCNLTSDSFFDDTCVGTGKEETISIISLFSVSGCGESSWKS